MTRKLILLGPAALFLTSCAIGPNYTRPQIQAPSQFRGAQPAAAAADSIANLSAFDLFHDPTLTALLKTALSQNNDLHIAVERVLEARSQYGITRSAIFPSLDATGQFAAVRNSSVGSFTFIPRGLNLAASYTQPGFSLSWEIDVWGRLRRLTESARAQYLATEEAQRGVISTVIADVTTNYLNLLELDLELEIAGNTRDAAQKGLELSICATSAAPRPASTYARRRSFSTRRQRRSRKQTVKSAKPKTRSASCWARIRAISSAARSFPRFRRRQPSPPVALRICSKGVLMFAKRKKI